MNLQKHLCWRPRSLWPAALTLLLGLGVLLYRGPGRALVRGHLGDVFVVAFLFFVMGAFITSRWFRVGFVFLVALLVELRQALVTTTSPTLVEALTVGATADPWDVLAYALGLVLAVLIERRM